MIRKMKKAATLIFLIAVLAGCSAPIAGYRSTTVPEIKKSALPADYKAAIKSKKPLLLFFYLPGDPTSKRVKPVVESLEAKYSSVMEFLYINGEKPESAELLRIYDPSHIPGIHVLNTEEEEVNKSSGFVDAKSVEKQILQVIPSH